MERRATATHAGWRGASSAPLPIYLGFTAASLLRIVRGDLALVLVLGWGLLLGMLGGLVLAAPARRR